MGWLDEAFGPAGKATGEVVRWEPEGDWGLIISDGPASETWYFLSDDVAGTVAPVVGNNVTFVGIPIPVGDVQYPYAEDVEIQDEEG